MQKQGGEMSEERTYSQDQIELIKNTIARGASDNELNLFLATCKRTGLDPFSRQIYMIERRFKDKNGDWQTKMEIQVSIDGFRVIAERTSLYQGQDGPYWCGADGKWCDVWLQSYPPSAAKIGALKKGFQQPLWGVARWESYAQTYSDGNPTKMWAKMGDVMLAKCAEALALRRAFPNDLSGLYTNDEMSQAEEVVQVKSAGPQVALPAPSQAKIAVTGTAKTDDIPEPEWLTLPFPPKEPEEFRRAREQREDNERLASPARLIPNQHPFAPPSSSYSSFDETNIPDPSSEVDTYKIPFGKFTGKTIKQAGLHDVVKYLDWMIEQAKGSGKPLSANAVKLQQMVDLAGKGTQK